LLFVVGKSAEIHLSPQDQVEPSLICQENQMTFTSMPYAAALLVVAADFDGGLLPTDVLHHMLALLLSSDNPDAGAPWRASYARIAGERGARRRDASRGPDLEAMSQVDKRCEELGLIKLWGRETRHDTFGRKIMLDQMAPPDEEFQDSAERVGQRALDLVSAGATPSELAVCARLHCMTRGENATTALTVAELVEISGLSRRTLLRVLEEFRDASEPNQRRLGVRAQQLLGARPIPNRWMLSFSDSNIALRDRPTAPKPIKIIGLPSCLSVGLKAESTWQAFDEDGEFSEDE
jgi:hypothetical protein